MDRAIRPFYHHLSEYIKYLIHACGTFQSIDKTRAAIHSIIPRNIRNFNHSCYDCGTGINNHANDRNYFQSPILEQN